MEAGHRSTAGIAAEPRVARSLEGGREIAQRLDSPYAHGMIAMVRGDQLAHARPMEARPDSLDQAEQLFRNHCTGVTWERDTVHNFVLWAFMQMGEIAELKRRWTVLYRESQERGDLYAATMLTAFYMTMIKLAGNEPIDSETECRARGRRQSSRGKRFHSPAFVRVRFAHASQSLSRRHHQCVGTDEPNLARIFAIAALADPDDPDPPAGAAARTAVAMAEKAARAGDLPPTGQAGRTSTRREGLPWALAHAHYIRAGIAACEEDAARAIETSKLPLSNTTTPRCPPGPDPAYRLGELEEGAESREHVKTPSSGSVARESSRRCAGRECTHRDSP